MHPPAVPYFRQETEYTCGPACLRMIVSAFSWDPGEEALRSLMRVTPEDGTARSDMSRTLTELGFVIAATIDAQWDDLVRASELGRLVIVNYIEPSSDDGHFAVMIHCDKDRVVLHDPWNGPLFTLERSAFLPRWRGSDEVGRWMVEIVSPVTGPARGDAST